MIIKLKEDAIVDGVERVKGEIINATSCPADCVIIKTNKQIKHKMKMKKEKRLKKQGQLKKNAKSKQKHI